MADGTVRINIELVKNAFQQALQSLERETKTTTTRTGKSLQDVARETGKTVNQIRSEVMKASAQYQKDGLSKSEAVKKAYEDIGVSAETTTTKVTKMSGLVKASLVGLSTVGIAAVGAIAKAGISFNAQMEKYTSNFKVMLGSQEEAVKKVEELKKMASKTPFEIGDLASATEMLLQYGVASEDTQSILQKLGDISLGNAEKLSGLTYAYSQMVSLQRVTREDINQMIERGFNPLKVISEETGESMAEVNQRLTDGKVSVDEITKALEIATSKGGQFYKGSEEGAKTFLGQLSTLKDNFNELSGNIMKPFFNFLSQSALPGAINLVGDLNNNVETLISTATGLATAFGAFKTLPILASGWGSAKAGLEAYIKTGQGLKASSALVGLLTRQITLSQVATQSATTATSLWTKALSFLSANKFLIIASAVIGIGTALYTASKQAGGFSELFNNIGEKISNLAGKAGEFISAFIKTISTNAPKIMKSLVSAITTAFNSIADNAPKILDSIVSIVTNAGNAIVENAPSIILKLGQALSQGLPQITQAGVDIILNLINGISQNLPALIQTGAEIITSFIQSFSDNLPQIINAGVQAINGLIQGIVQNLPTILDAGVELLNGLIQGIVQNLPILIEGAIQILNALIQGFTENIEPILEAGLYLIMSLVQGLVESIPILVQAIPQIITALLNGIITALPQLIVAGYQILFTLLGAIIQNLPTIIQAGYKIVFAILGAIIQSLPQIFNAGVQLVQMLWQGIQSLVAWLLQQLKTFVAQIPQKIKQGIQAVKNIGRTLIQLLWKGISSLVSWLLGKVKSFASDIPGKIKQGFSNIKNIGRNLVEGVWNGIAGAKDWLIGKIRGWAGDTIDSIKSFFGINSPSTIMRDLIGKNLVVGMAVGIDKNAKYAIKSMKALGTKIQKTANIPVSIGRGSAGSYYNHSVTNDSRQVIQNFYNKTTTPYEAYKKVGGAFAY